MWAIYYNDGSVVEGSSDDDWRHAPDNGVQVVVVKRPPPTVRPDRHKTGFVGCDRLKPHVTFYTGVDKYDPLGYGHEKFGTLMRDTEYQAIWDRAYGDY